jgi:hypothetical protein
VIVPGPPAAGAVILVGLAEKVHDAPGWLTWKALPAIVSVAVLAPVPGFGCAVNETVPEPEPVEPLDIVTHDAPLAAVQAHPELVVTETLPVPPAAGTVPLVGAIVYEQGAAA